MWCKKCNTETNDKICERCGSKTEEDIPYEIYWCEDCNIPLIKAVNSADKDCCPICGKKTLYLTSDIRPVFPEERLLLEIMLEKPLEFFEKSVWASNNRYYIDGKTITINSSLYKKHTPDWIREKLDEYRRQNNYDYFDKYINLFVRANRDRLINLAYFRRFKRHCGNERSYFGRLKVKDKDTID